MATLLNSGKTTLSLDRSRNRRNFGDSFKNPGSATDSRVRAQFRNPAGPRAARRSAPADLTGTDLPPRNAAALPLLSHREKILVDGDLNRHALGFLVWKYRLDDPANSVDIDLMVLTHADGDHLKGLTPIMEHPQIHVKRIIHKGIAIYSSGHDTRIGSRNAAKTRLTTTHDGLAELQGDSDLDPTMTAWRDAEGAEYGRVDVDTGTIVVGDSDVTLEVLGPIREAEGYYKWLDGSGRNHNHTTNGRFGRLPRSTSARSRTSISTTSNQDAPSMFLPGTLTHPEVPIPYSIARQPARGR